MAAWDDVLSERDRRVVTESGHGGRMGLGSRPALLVVDAQNGFVGLRDDIFASMKVYPRSIGEEAWAAVDRIAEVLAVARQRGIPVYFSQSGVLPGEERFDSFARKHTLAEDPSRQPWPSYDIVAEIAPRPGEVVIQKRFASPFLGTPLVSFLIADHVDTLLVCGFVTAGCVRAAVVDAHGYNLRIGVIGDGCADRVQLSHKASLLDMDMKYADVLSAAEAVAYLDGLGARGLETEGPATEAFTARASERA
jgi:maleamate amidohydrolase